MKNVVFEIKKVFASRMIIVVAVLFIVNIIVCALTTVPEEYEQVLIDKTPSVIDLYIDDTEAFKIKYQKMLADYSDVLLESDQDSVFFGIDPSGKMGLPSEYSGSAMYSDMYLFARTIKVINGPSNFNNELNNLIQDAHSNLDEYENKGISSNSYSYKYQEKVIDIYNKLLAETRYGVEYSHGWDTYFNYRALDIFIVLSVIVVCGIMFTYEKHSGMFVIQRCVKNSGARQVLTKVCAATLLTFSIVILFSAATFGVIGITTGYSSIYNAAQTTETFRLTPFVISVGEIFFLSLLVKLIAFVTFSICILLVSFFFYNYITIYAISAVLYAINFILNRIDYLNTSNPLQYINLVAASNASGLLERYRSINLFGMETNLLLFWILLSALAFVAIWAVLSELSKVCPERLKMKV